jgi:5-hydroxytryptamine receptor 1
MYNMAQIEDDEAGKNCSAEMKLYNSSLGIALAVPDWEAVTTGLALTALIILVLVGNIFVIISIFKHKALRIAQNFFLVSLAVADLTVAVFVLPFSVIYQIVGRWKFGVILCKMWLTCDVLCCTASILHLCVIALDRYWAITDPLNYARKRTQTRVLVMIAGVWALSITISSPPLFGWNDWESILRNGTMCELTVEQGYVVYSALGSFFIPLFIMSVVYVEIFVAAKRRLKQRARASKLSFVKRNRHPSSPREQDSTSSDANLNGRLQVREDIVNEKNRSEKNKNCDGHLEEKNRRKLLVTEDSITDNDEDPSLGSPCVKDLSNRTTTTTLGSQASRSVSECTTPTAVRRGSDVAPDSSTRKYAPANIFKQVKQRISLSKERRAARTLGIIMGVFVVCWLPFFLMYVIVPFCVSCCPSDKLKHSMTWLGYVNSALNPIIYTIFNMDFRKAFKKLLHIK